MAIGIGLKQVEEALERKAASVQREFIQISDQLDDLGRRMLEVDEDERKEIRAEQERLKQYQAGVADEVNEWRNRARRVRNQPGVDSLRNYLNELLELDDEGVQAAAKTALHLLDLPPEERQIQEEDVRLEAQSPAGRLLERARIEYDLRGADPGARRREAVTFANRPGIPQDEAVIREVAEAMEDPDPLVRELATLTTIQLHRFRAMRLADMDLAHQSVQFLARINSPEVVPVLIEVVKNPRSGFIQGEAGAPEETDNSRSRMVALLRLVEWHTAEVQTLLRSMKFDQDPHIVKASERALELFPGQWTGPIRDLGSPQ